MRKLEMLYEGKAKKVYKTEKEDQYIVYYKDDATAGNGAKKGTIQEKGKMNNAISSILFEILEKEGIPTHFVKKLNEREMLVKAVKILPLEVLVRNITAGSLCKRLGLEEGIILQKPVLEFCYKNDDLGDPMVNEDHIQMLKLVTEEEVNFIKKMALKVNTILKEFFDELGIQLVDFKLEFGKYHDSILLADEISPDTCRFWDKETKEKLDKDRFRRDLGKIEEGYEEVLNRLLKGEK